MQHKHKIEEKLEKLRADIEIRRLELCPFRPDLSITSNSVIMSQSDKLNKTNKTEKKYYETDYSFKTISERRDKLINHLKEKHAREAPVYTFVPEINKK